MAKDSKKALVPKLRFPKFRGSAEWKAKRMDSLYSFMRNNTLSRDKLNYVAGTAKNIHYGDIHTKFSTLFDITKERVPFINVTEELPHADADDYCVESDLVFADSSEDTNDVGKCIEIVRLEKQHLLAGQHTILARQKNSEFVIGFGGRVFQSARVRSQIQHEAQGTKVYAISPTRLARIEVAYPRDKDEQQKIADCLSSLDELIAAQGRKVEALKTYKRGLMQQLFTREGETLPRLRFPEFRDAPEWEETKLASLGELVSGLTYSPDDVRNSGLLVLRSSNVQNAEIALDDNVYVTPVIKGANLVRPNDILICVRNGSKSLIGKSALIPVGMPLCTHGAFMTVFRAHAPQFAFQLMQSALFHKQVAADLGATINSINGSQLLRYRFVVPGPDEQNRIADFLSSLTARIATEAKTLVSLKAHKKGLMQQLFPSPVEA